MSAESLSYQSVRAIVWNEEEASHLIIRSVYARSSFAGVRVHSPPSATRTSLRYGYVYEDLNFYVRD